MDTLVDSSEKTVRWLSKIRVFCMNKLHNTTYKEGKYWASFKNLQTKRNFVYLHPTKNQIRIFTRLPDGSDQNLTSTPASQNWADMYPTIFTLREEAAFKVALDLVKKSYHYDLSIN